MKWTTELPEKSGWYFTRFENRSCFGIAFYCSAQRAVYEAGFPKYHAEDFEGEWGDRIEMPKE